MSADVDACGVSPIVGIGRYGGGQGLVVQGPVVQGLAVQGLAVQEPVVQGLSRSELGAGGGMHVG